MPFRGHGDHAAYVKELSAIMPEVAGVRRFGAAALDLAYVEAMLDRGEIAAGNEAIHRQLIALLKG
jgi:hypothetical protein